MPLPGGQRLMRGPGEGAQPLASPMVIRAGRIIVMACAIWVGLAVLMSTGLFSSAPYRINPADAPRRSNAPRRPTCDPLSSPGYVANIPGTAGVVSTTGPLARWDTFDPHCRPIGYSGLWSLLLSRYPNSPYHDILTQDPSAKVATQLAARALGNREINDVARNRTVLLVGDHTDRALVNQICSLAGQNAQAVTGFHPWAKHLNPDLGQDKSTTKRARGPPKNSFHTTHHIADYCYLPQDDFLLISVYHFGSSPGTRWGNWNHGGLSWGPAEFEGRVEQLYQPLMKGLSDSSIYSGVIPPTRLSSDPDLIVFQTGLWDLARRAQDAVRAQADTNKAGDESFLFDWRTRSTEMLQSLSKAFPTSTLAWRTVPHIPDGPEATLGRLIRTTHADLGGVQLDAPILSEIDEGEDAAPLHVIWAAALNAAVKSAFTLPSWSLRGTKDVKGGVPKDTWFIPWADLVRAHTDLLADPLILAPYPSASLFAEVLLQTLYYV